jgi:hypothetical protein
LKDRKGKQVLFGCLTVGRGGHKERVKGEYWMYFIFMSENKAMKPVEFIL